MQINSIASLCPFDGVPTYATSKAAALSLTQALRRELAAAGVPVFSVLPGPLETDMAASMDFEKAGPSVVAREILRAVEAGAPLDLFPDAYAQTFWRDLTADPAATLFAPGRP